MCSTELLFATQPRCVSQRLAGHHRQPGIVADSDARRQPGRLLRMGKPDTIGCVAKPKKIAGKRVAVRARVRGRSLDLLDPIPLRDGAEVLVSISEPAEARDFDALRRAAGAWRGMVDAESLITNIYADRLVATGSSPLV